MGFLKFNDTNYFKSFIVDPEVKGLCKNKLDKLSRRIFVGVQGAAAGSWLN